MKKTQFTESQIIAMLKQHEQGIKVQEIARANGISEKTIAHIPLKVFSIVSYWFVFVYLVKIISYE